MSIEAVSSSYDLDSEELRIRNLQNTGAAVPADSSAQTREPLSSTSVSSLSSSNSEPSPPQYRPQLSAPKDAPPSLARKKHPMVGILRVIQANDPLNQKETSQFKNDTDADLAEINRLTAEKTQAVQNAAKENESRNTWGVLSNVASYVASATSIVLGAACVASGVGSAAGALLIASGGIGLANQLMHDTHGWEAVVSWFTKSEELQSKIAQKIEMGAFFLSLGLGLAGGVWAYTAGAFAAAAETSRQTLTGKIGQIIGLGGAFMGAGSRLGAALVERRIAFLHARIREIETRMTTDQQNIYQSTTTVGKNIEQNQSMEEVAKKGISMLQISID